MRKYLITGLVILLPLAVTLAIVMFIINLLTGPFVGIVREILSRYNLLETGFWFLGAEQVQRLFSQALILTLLFFFTVGLGMLARWFFVHYLIRFSDYIFHQIPFVRAIYKTSQDVINTIFTTDTQSFKQVVMVPFPNADTRSVGLLTREQVEGTAEGDDGELVAVFVPTTPNPTSGFLMLFKRHDLVFLDMKVEQALKYIISCGVIATPFKTMQEPPECDVTS